MYNMGDMVSGITTSRLVELQKYGSIDDFTKRYKSSNTISVNGVDYGKSDANAEVYYYIDNIMFVDDLVDDITRYYYTPIMGGVGLVNKNIYKDPDKCNVVNNPSIDNDISIERQEISVFERVFRLSDLRDLKEVISYGGSNYFKIINNI